MAHELIDAVTATPAGPITVGLGQSLDLVASYTLNGPPPGSPTSSSYTLNLLRVSPPFAGTIDSQAAAVANTDYTLTIPASFLNAVGTYTFKVEGYVLYGPFDEQFVDSNTVTVHVAEAREIEAELPDRTLTAGLPDRTVDAELPGRTVEAGLPSRTIEGELPNRNIEAGLG